MATEVDVRRELGMISRLQQVDSQLQDLELEKGDLPNLVKRLSMEIEQLNQELEALRERSAEIGKEKRSLEGQVQMARVKQERYKEQLYAVTTNREYDAITVEINSIRTQIESSENSQQSLMKEEEEISGRVEAIEQRLGELETEFKERESELGDKVEETQSEELQLEHEREKLIVRIKKPIFAHYERIRTAREGVGAAHLFASACGACYAVVPPQRQAEIRKMVDIILCESCGVILLPEEEHMRS